MRLRLLALAIASSAVAACFLSTSLDGFSGGGTENEAGPEAASEASPPPPPPPPPVDGGSDAPDAAFHCSDIVPTPVFCTDFDQGTLDSITGPPDTNGPATVDLDDAVFFSPGHSMRVSIPATTTGIPRGKIIRDVGFAPTSKIVVEMDHRIDSADQSSTGTITISFPNYNITLFLGGGSAKLREGIAPDGGAFVYTSTDRSTPPNHTWFHLSLVVTIATGASNVVLSYDGVPQSALPLVIDKYLTASWHVDIGHSYISTPDTGRLIHIDNLVVDAK